MLARQGELTGLDRWPLLREAALHVGHPATRTRGTVCGSVAAGSPRAELPAALRVLGASYRVRSPRGERVLDAFPPLEPDELLVEIEVPPHPERWRFFEYAPTLGDWPHVGVAVAGDRIEEFGVALGEPWQRAMIEAALA